MKDKHYIGAQYSNEAWGVHNGEWRHFGVASGWNNNLMTDSFGGVTIGGAGFEIDGNGVFPFVRLTSSTYIDENNVQWFLLGLLDNAYHPTTAGWECDNNSHYSWFVGLRSPQKFNGNTPVYLTKDLEQLKNFCDNWENQEGGDGAEDWVGGYKLALDKIKWRNGRKIIYHICDSPAHGQ